MSTNKQEKSADYWRRACYRKASEATDAKNALSVVSAERDALQKEVEQLRDRLTCYCGQDMDNHKDWEAGHTAVSMYDYDIDVLREKNARMEKMLNAGGRSNSTGCVWCENTGAVHVDPNDLSQGIEGCPVCTIRKRPQQPKNYIDYEMLPHTVRIKVNGVDYIIPRDKLKEVTKEVRWEAPLDTRTATDLDE